MAQRLARHALAQFAGAPLLAGPVDFFVEPTLEPAELSLAKITVEIAELLPGLIHELSGVEVAERVGGKVTDATHTPVDVLQAAALVVRRRKIERLLELLVPDAGHVGRR